MTYRDSLPFARFALAFTLGAVSLATVACGGKTSLYDDPSLFPRPVDAGCIGPTCARPIGYAFTPINLMFVDACSAPGATRMLASADDTVGPAVPIPFGFAYWGHEYSEVHPTSNGYVIFGPGNATTNNVYYPSGPLPSASRPHPAAFAYNSDLYQRSTGGICIATVGTAPARRLVIETIDAAFCCGDSNPAHLTFEIVLNEADESIDFVYQRVDPTGGEGRSVLVAVQDENGTMGSTYRFAPVPMLGVSAGSALHLVPMR